MAQFVTLQADGLTKLRDMNERLVSYNVEMTARCMTCDPDTPPLAVAPV